MGVPFAVGIKGQQVFLCCRGCTDAALKDPDLQVRQAAALTLGELGAEARTAVGGRGVEKIAEALRLARFNVSLDEPGRPAWQRHPTPLESAVLP